MKRFLSIAVSLLAASLLATAWSTAASAQTQPAPRNPNIVVDYIEPRPPIDPQDKDYNNDMAAYQRFMKIHARLKERQVLEQLSMFLAPLKLPKTLRVRTKTCGVVNAPSTIPTNTA